MFIINFFLPILLLVIYEIIVNKKSFSPRSLANVKFILTSLGALIFAYLTLTVTFLNFTAMLSFDLLTLLVGLGASVMFVVIKHFITLLKKKESVVAFALFSLCVALFLEGFIFNMRFYQTYYYEPVDVTDSIDFSYNFITVPDSDKNEYKITNGSSASFEIKDINKKIHNVYFDVSAIDRYDSVVISNVTAYFTDESNALYLRTPAQDVTTEVESTKFLHLLTNGETKDLKINLYSSNADTYVINKVALNMNQNFSFNSLRFFLVALVMFLVWFLRPSSFVYKYKMSFSKRQSNLTTLIIVLQIVLLVVITLANPVFKGNASAHHAQYQQLADAFLDGRLYLEAEPPEYLTEMDNPYDYYLRASEATKNGQSYYWDAAYYEGRYYVYFGALPALLLYLPFKFFTGQDLSNRAAIQFFLCLFVLGAFTLIEKIIKKYFKPERIPYVSFLAVTLIFINASGAVFIAKRPDFYSLPIISSLAFCMFGLYLWMCSTDKEGKVKPLYAAAGSLCMAAVAGCRPQFLLLSALAIIIFWNSVFKDRSLFSKKSIGTTIAICLPYVIVAAAVMWYNFARFGSPFDFGQNYNLTTNDMTGRGFRFERVGLSLFTYFFQLPNITASFPFIDNVSIATGYLGTTITEAMFGGIYATIPLLWILFLVPSMWKKLKKKNILAFVLTLVGISFFIGMFDAQGAGILQRYVSDFAYLAILAAIFVIFFMYERSRGARTKQLNAFVTFSLFASGAYCMFIIFAIYGTEIYYYNPTLFETFSDVFQFWR